MPIEISVLPMATPMMTMPRTLGRRRKWEKRLHVHITGTITVAVFSSHLPSVLQALDPVPRTVAAAVAQHLTGQEQVTDAFVTGASTALQIGAAATLLAGTTVVALARSAIQFTRTAVPRAGPFSRLRRTARSTV